MEKDTITIAIAILTLLYTVAIVPIINLWSQVKNNASAIENMKKEIDKIDITSLHTDMSVMKNTLDTFQSELKELIKIFNTTNKELHQVVIKLENVTKEVNRLRDL